MTESDAGRVAVYDPAGEISLLSLAAVLLRWRRPIAALIILGGLFGAVRGLRTPVMYESSATFIPQASESSPAGLASAASQLGLRPSGTGGTQMYVALLTTRALLERIALDSIDLSDETGTRRVAVTEVLGIRAPTATKRTAAAVSALRGMIDASEVRSLNGVNVTITSGSPAVSQGVAERLVRGVNEFNLQTRRSQATAERQFVEVQADLAQRALRDAEDRLQAFLQRNRDIAGSPMLTFERDRLQREVALRQQLATNWLQNREEVKIREVRDTPVITVFEDPRLPTAPMPRKIGQKAALGAMAGGVLGIVLAFFAHGIARARLLSTDAAQEFFAQLERATPRALRRVTWARWSGRTRPGAERS